MEDIQTPEYTTCVTISEQKEVRRLSGNELLSKDNLTPPNSGDYIVDIIDEHVKDPTANEVNEQMIQMLEVNSQDEYTPNKKKQKHELLLIQRALSVARLSSKHN